MNIREFKTKWQHLFTPLSLFILDYNENPKDKKIRLQLLGSIIGNNDDLSEQVLNNFDAFCHKILKGVNAFDVIKKLTKHERWMEAFYNAFRSKHEDRLERLEYVLQAYSKTPGYDTYICISFEDLESLDFVFDEERDKFLKDLYDIYIKYGYLRNAVALYEHFVHDHLPRAALLEFRKKCCYGIIFPEAYNYAGMLLTEIRFGKSLKNHELVVMPQRQQEKRA